MSDHAYIGAEIVAVRRLADGELAREGWDGQQPPVAFELSNGRLVYPAQDAEGNGPGALFAYDEAEGEYLRVPAEQEVTA